MLIAFRFGRLVSTFPENALRSASPQRIPDVSGGAAALLEIFKIWQTFGSELCVPIARRGNRG
jgi:hypothetical protein